MPPKNNTQKIEELAEKVGAHIPLTEYRLKVLDQRVQKLEELPPQVARVEERVKPLEKGSDRNWQVWLALIGAGLALLIALFKK